MTKVRMKQTVTGMFHGNPAGAQRGEIHDVGDEAERYISVGIAEPLGEERAVTEDDDTETAVPKKAVGRPKKAPPGTTTTPPAGGK